ncbi:MAG: type II toxin-antitoxin system RelE/ParE family toxin [Alcanivoracaceae bacterium]|nr:type II toxin-antitoxin system RelE/ParE family toxin [Alcanivoracaceae bacterium]
MKLEILELAQFEIEDSKDYYNLHQAKLGEVFKKDVQDSIDRIIESPILYPEIMRPIRRCLLHRFPFGIMYAINNDTIVVLAVVHQSRKPFYWVDRLV